MSTFHENQQPSHQHVQRAWEPSLASLREQAADSLAGLADVMCEQWCRRMRMRRGVLLAPWTENDSHNESLRFFDQWRKGVLPHRRLMYVCKAVPALRDRVQAWLRSPLHPDDVLAQVMSRFAWVGGVCTPVAMESGDAGYRDLECECLRTTVEHVQRLKSQDCGLEAEMPNAGGSRWIADIALSALVGTSIIVFRDRLRKRLE